MPTINPSLVRSRATVCPHGSVAMALRLGLHARLMASRATQPGDG
jgi:hypothetical protein